MSTDLVLAPLPRSPRRRPTLGKRLRWGVRRAPRSLRQIPGMCRRELRYAGKGVGLAYRRWRTWCRVEETATRVDRLEKRTETAALNIDRQRRNNRKISVAGATLVAAGVAFLAVWWPLLLAAAVTVLMAILDAVGRRVTEELGLQKGRVTPFREGESLRSVVASVKEYVIDTKTKALVTDAEYDGGDGVALALRHDGPLDQGFVEGLERWLRTYRGAIHVIEDRTARGGSRVSVSWRDRLAVSTAPPLLAPASRHGAQPAVVGVSANGDPTLVDRWRTNVVLVGQPGSGKSSAGWVLLDADTANPDIRVVGIDLRGGGGPLLNAWGDLVEDMATTVGDAEKLLDWLLAEAQGRTTMLGARSRPGARNPGPENWTPKDGQQHVLYIEELPLLADEKSLVSKYAELLRIGRAPAVCSVAIAQDMAKETVGSTSFRKHVMTTVLFACGSDDVTNLMGRGSLAAGWRPDLLLPADGINPNDAGRCYIRSPRYPHPMQHRWFRLDNAETDIHPRVFERLAARGAPVDLGKGQQDDVLDAEVVDEVDAAIGEVFRARGRMWLPTQVILDDLTARGVVLDPRDLRKRMGGAATRDDFEGRRVRGYSRP